MVEEGNSVWYKGAMYNGFSNKQGASTLELTRAYELAKTNIILDFERKRFSQRQQLGLATWKEEFEMNKKNLKDMLDNDQITEGEYSKALRDMKINNVKEYFDYYKDLFKNAVESMMNAEMALLDQQYDVQIAAAEGNAEEVERLEEEKAQKKLDIEKKYADTQFAITASEIIANTALAIMGAYSSLGPIAGSIAAALMGAAGAAQLVAANAERQKVKQMTLSSSGSSSSSRSRVVTGAEDGGYVDVVRSQDGETYNARRRGNQRGYIDDTSILVSEDGKEFVANANSVSNPDVKRILDVVDMAQRGGYEKQLNMKSIMAAMSTRGYASGGFGVGVKSDQQSVFPLLGDDPDIGGVMMEVLELLRYLKENGISATVVLTELEKKMALQQQSNKLGSKNLTS